MCIRDRFFCISRKDDLSCLQHICSVGDRKSFLPVVQLADTHYDHGYEAEDEHQRTQQSEKVHGLDAEPGKEPKGKQVQIPVYKTVQPELGLSVFACLMVHHFLADFLEAGVLGQVRDVAPVVKSNLGESIQLK